MTQPRSQSQNVRASNTNEQSRGSYRVPFPAVPVRQNTNVLPPCVSASSPTTEHQHADARYRVLSSS